MKKKFASYLATGKAATLPFFAGNSLADMQEMSMAELVSTDEVHIVGKCSDSDSSVMNVVITGLKSGDQVFLGSSNDTGQLYPNDYPAMQIGETNLRFLTNFVVSGIDFGDILEDYYPYGEDNFEEATYTVSVPIALDDLLTQQAGFYMQALVYREGEPEALFSELDKVEGICCSSYDGGDGGNGGMYGGTGGSSDGCYGGISTSVAPGEGSDGNNVYGGTGGDGSSSSDDTGGDGSSSSGDTGGDGDDMYGGTGGDGSSSSGDTGGDGGDMYGGTGGDGGTGDTGGSAY